MTIPKTGCFPAFSIFVCINSTKINETFRRFITGNAPIFRGNAVQEIGRRTPSRILTSVGCSALIVYNYNHACKCTMVLLSLQRAIFNELVMLTFLIILSVVALAIGLANIGRDNEQPKIDDGIKDAVSQIMDGTWEKEQKKFWNDMLEIVLSQHKHERSITFTVVGGYYRSKAAQEEYIYLEKASPISLRREPDNSYDPYAVKVISDRKHIGYVPKDLSRLVSEVIDQKCVSDCYVIDNDYAFRNEDADGMQVTLWIKDKFENRLDLDGIDPPEEPNKQD